MTDATAPRPGVRAHASRPCRHLLRAAAARTASPGTRCASISASRFRTSKRSMRSGSWAGRWMSGRRPSIPGSSRREGGDPRGGGRAARCRISASASAISSWPMRSAAWCSRPRDPRSACSRSRARRPARAHALLDGLPQRPRVLQWHAAEVVEPPAGAKVLASSTDCGVQAIAVGERALGLQFHLEVDHPTLEGWLAIPDNVAALVRRRGPEGARAFVEEAHTHMAEFNRSARALHANFWARLPQPDAARQRRAWAASARSAR